MFLQKKLSRWKEQNFITQEQCDQILKFERQRAGNTFWRTTFIIAGLLIGLGICLLVAANWDVLGTVTKVAGDFVILGGLFYTAWRCVAAGKKGLTELFAILSFLMIGATIGLIGQVFNLEGGWRSFALSWALLGLPFVAVSRALFFNMGWWCLVLSSVSVRWLDILWHDINSSIVTVACLCLLSYAGSKLDEVARPYTLLSKAFSKLTLWIAYLGVWGIGICWGLEWHHHAGWTLLADGVVFAFLAGRMGLAVKMQNITSLRRNAILAEIYIFVLFATAFGNLFMSGLGFILAGLAILGMIYVFRRTSGYIKSMEVFK